MAISAGIRGITQLLPVVELNDAADQLSTDLARLFPVRNDPIQLTIYVEWLRSKNIGWTVQRVQAQRQCLDDGRITVDHLIGQALEAEHLPVESVVTDEVATHHVRMR